MAQGYKGFAQIAREANRNIKAMKREIENQDIDVLEPKEKEFSLSGGDFFKQHPEKLLAEPYEASGRFGTVTKYKPKAGKKAIEVLADIETPVFIAHGITDISAGASVIIPDVEKSVPTPEAGENRLKAIEESEQGVVKRARSKKKELMDFEEPSTKPTIPFEDILRTYNKDLSTDEIKAFLWYMHNQGNTYKGKWLNILNPTLLSQEQESAYINNWVKSGILFYYKGELLPAFIYFSENLYDRKAIFDQDKDSIISIYGEETAKVHENKLNEAFGEIYNNRLKLDNPDVEKRLHLKPYGDFTNSIKIRNWNLDNNTNEPMPFQVITRVDGSINWYSPTSHFRYRDPKKDELTITDAFRWWLKYDYNRPSLPHTFQAEDIFKYYLDKRKRGKDVDPTVFARMRALAKDAGDKLFSRFLAEVILENDRVKIETEWNMLFNSSRNLRTEKIPIAFEVALEYWNDIMQIKIEKREAVAFASVRGSSLNAYEVGVGKTPSAIFTIAQFLEAEHCKRPCIIVPNQVYRQFSSEIKGILPHRKVNDLYNLSQDYYEKLLDDNGNVKAVEHGSITMLTYEGFEQIGFNEETASYLMEELKDAIVQITNLPEGESKAEEKRRLRQEEKLEGLLGKALQKTKTNIEDLGFDFVCFDEAHALKNIFSQVKSKSSKAGQDDDDEEEKGKEKMGKKMYEISGSTSTRGIKAYMLCSYIQLKNNGRNVLLLTATPFTNSPLEVYSMLSLVAKDELKRMKLSNLNDFFDNYCQISYELVIDSKLRPVRKQVFKSFDNLQSLQKLVYKYMIHKEAGKKDMNGNFIPICRPNKRVLPYKGYFDYDEKAKTVTFIPAKEDEYIDVVLPLSPEQKEFMDEIVKYVEGKISYEVLEGRGRARVDLANLTGDEDEETKKSIEDALLEESAMDDDEKAGVRTLRGVSLARNLTISPYLYAFSGLGKPDYKNYVEKSPKLKYVMKCIKSVKKWHEDRKEAVSGQVIYMDRGKAYFELLKEYLVKELGYEPHEIGIIRSGGKEGTKEHKSFVQNTFNGEKYDDATKLFTKIPDEERIKIIIGTASIREGLNLQKYSSVLYNCNVDWNPTDEIQLEGRIWRQGNPFRNVRIVIPLLSDSMDIFIFEKLSQKTARINSIWNYDGQSNVLKVEEIDPSEQKMALITDPEVIAELEVEGRETEMNEEISVINNTIQTAKNVISFFEERDTFEKELNKVLKIIDPGKAYPSIEAMISRFERLIKDQDDEKKPELRKAISKKLADANIDRYDYEFVAYDYSDGYELTKGYSYGSMKGAVANIRKAKHTFFERLEVAENEKAIEEFIKDQENKKKRIEEDLTNLKSKEYLQKRAKEIDRERKEKKINVVTVEQRVKEFEKLNDLLGIRDLDKIDTLDEPVMAEMKGCPPVTKDGKPDVSPEGIKKLEACLERIPQTKDQNTDETGVYTEKRLKLHKVIKGKLRAGLACKTERDKPIAILMSGVPGCFTAGQLIHTDKGVKPISEIKEGDMVLSYDHVHRINEYRKILQVHKYNEREDRLFRIRLKDGTIIEVTENHEFFDGVRYVKVKDILLSLTDKHK